MAWKDNFSTLFELLPIGAYRIDARTADLRANAAMVRMFGFASEEELRAHFKASPSSLYVNPRRRAQFRARLETKGTVRDFVSEMRQQGSSETLWVSENAHLVRDAKGKVLYHEGTVEDITERVRVRRALELTLDHAGRGITKVDAQGRIVLYNRSLLEMLDLPAELLARGPLLSEVIRFQQERGDFVVDGEAVFNRDLQTLTHVDDKVSVVDLHATAGRYLRRTRAGKVIEVATEKMPDGGFVRTFSDVTAYVDAQQALGEKTNALQIALDSMSQGIAAIDPQDRVVMSNRRFQELLGLGDELLATRPTLAELLELQVERGDFGEDFGAVDANARHFIANNIKPVDGPLKYMRRTREGRSMEVLTRALPDGGAVRTFTDMTDYVAAQEALARKEAQLRAVVSNIPDRVWLKDIDGVYLLSNPAHWRHFGLREDEIIGRTAHEIFGKEVGDRHRATDLQAMAMDEPLAFDEERIEHAPGRRHVEVVKVAVHDDAGACIGLLGIARDITERKRVEAALVAAKEAGEASGSALLSLVGDVLDFSKIEADEFVLARAPVDIEECAERALEAHGTAAAQKGIELACHVHPGVPAAIMGDAVRLKQVLVSLVGNAIKSGGRGEVAVTLRTTEAAQGTMLRVSVRDAGTHDGAPLGLVICRRLVELMGGRLWSEPGEGAGCDVQFELPMEPAEPADRFVPARALNGRAALVAATSTSQRDMLAARMSRFGMKVFTAATADTAGARFREVPIEIAVIDGARLADAIRGAAPAKLPMLVLESLGSTLRRSRGPQERILARPATTRALHDAVASFFRTPQDENARSAPVMNMDAEARREIIDLFAQEAPRLQREVHRAVGQGDAKAALIAAHTLAGSAGYFDADELRQLCRRIEAAAESEELETVRGLLPGFDKAVSTALTEAARLAAAS